MRQRAAHCRLLAIRDAQQPETAKQWIGIAKQWDLLAETSETGSALRAVEGSAGGRQSPLASRHFSASMNTGNFATLAAIRRASSCVSRFITARRDSIERIGLEIDMGERLAAGVGTLDLGYGLPDL